MTVKLRGVRAVRITGDYIKLDALLKYASIASTGGEAKVLINNGDVFVDGASCTQRGKKIRPGSIVRYDGDVILVKEIKSRAKKDTLWL